MKQHSLLNGRLQRHYCPRHSWPQQSSDSPQVLPLPSRGRAAVIPSTRRKKAACTWLKWRATRATQKLLECTCRMPRAPARITRGIASREPLNRAGASSRLVPHGETRLRDSSSPFRSPGTLRPESMTMGDGKHDSHRGTGIQPSAQSQTRALRASGDCRVDPGARTGAGMGLGDSVG